MKKGILLLSISFAFSYAVECKYHTVKKGETIEKIAKTYGVSLRELTSANKEIDPKKLKEGQKLCIPTKKASTKRAEKKEETKEAYSYYTVKKGARLEHVAKATGVPLKELERLNPELKGKWLEAGTKVKLPATQRAERKEETKEAYSYYTVKKGARLEHVAKATGVPLKELERLNPELKGKWLKAGTKVKLPATQRAERKEETKEAYSYYTVKKGARLEHVAKATGVPLKELERLNPELKGRWLKAGTKVKLPATQKVEEKVVKSEPQVIKRQPEAFLEQAQEKEQKSSIPQNLKIDMPVDGKLVKGQKGVEILAPCSSSVRVVEDGKVIYSGGDLQAYGNMVIVEHDRFISLYAYNEENLVKRGEKVSKGQIIAKVGKKDGSDSCALRFEIRSKDGVPLDPTEYFKDLH